MTIRKHRGYVATLTNYPALFRHTYWGCFEISDDSGKPDIISNRNEFVEEFKIVKQGAGKRVYRAANRDYRGRLEDHQEIYTTAGGGVVIIVSPYSKVISQALLDIGFKQYKQLYHASATTFVAHYASKAAALAALKSVKEVSTESR
jgi:hypothetical protein